MFAELLIVYSPSALTSAESPHHGFQSAGSGSLRPARAIHSKSYKQTSRMLIISTELMEQHDCLKLCCKTYLFIFQVHTKPMAYSRISAQQQECHWDLSRYTEARWPDSHHQVWPDWASPCGMICLRRTAFPRHIPRRRRTGRPKRLTANTCRSPGKAATGTTGGYCEGGMNLYGIAKKPIRQMTGDRVAMMAIDVNYFLHRFGFLRRGSQTPAVSVLHWSPHCRAAKAEGTKRLPWPL